MKIRNLAGLLIVVIFGSCFEQRTKGGGQIEEDSNRAYKRKSGLRIENGINRGLNYTDSSGTDYSIRYIPVKITNDSVFTIHFKLLFSKKYNYPIAIDNEDFKVIPLPKEWAVEGSEITDSMYNELPELIDEPWVDKILKPNEELVFGIATLYSRPVRVCGVLPSVLLSQNDKVLYKACDVGQSALDNSTNSQMRLLLKLDYCRNSDSPSCTLISCGQISYAEN